MKTALKKFFSVKSSPWLVIMIGEYEVKDYEFETFHHPERLFWKAEKPVGDQINDVYNLAIINHKRRTCLYIKQV